MSTEEQRSKWREINAKRKDYREHYWKQRPEKLAEHTKKWLATHQEHRKEYRKGWNTINKQKLRTYLLTHNYGMTFHQVQEMYISQNGCCGICGTRFRSRRHIHIDHNHTTKKVRALLCHKCNVGLGYFSQLTHDPKGSVLAREEPLTIGWLTATCLSGCSATRKSV